LPDTALELRSLATSQGTLELSLRDVPVPAPAANEVLVRLEAAPINPSDLGLLIAGADMATATVTGTSDRPIVTASLGPVALEALSARLDQSLPVGNEGAGVVVAAGSSEAAQALLGKRVGIAGGAMYAQYRVVAVAACLVLPDGATAKDGASSFVNPLTALGMLETMRREGHSALVHTAAASNLGQMLVKLCMKDGVPLVNVVRKPDQRRCSGHWVRSTSSTRRLRPSRPSSTRRSRAPSVRSGESSRRRTTSGPARRRPRPGHTLQRSMTPTNYAAPPSVVPTQNRRHRLAAMVGAGVSAGSWRRRNSSGRPYRRRRGAPAANGVATLVAT
jgi:hypothetical protein